MRLLVFLCVVTTVIAASAHASNPVRATMATSSTTPLAGTPWRYTITAKDGTGKPLRAKVRLQTLLGTVVVSCWKRTAIVPCSGANAGTWITFTGRRTSVIRWPAHPARVQLTFQAVVLARSRSLRLRAPLLVQLP